MQSERISPDTAATRQLRHDLRRRVLITNFLKDRQTCVPLTSPTRTKTSRMWGYSQEPVGDLSVVKPTEAVRVGEPAAVPVIRTRRVKSPRKIGSPRVTLSILSSRSMERSESYKKAVLEGNKNLVDPDADDYPASKKPRTSVSTKCEKQVPSFRSYLSSSNLLPNKPSSTAAFSDPQSLLHQTSVAPSSNQHASNHVSANHVPSRPVPSDRALSTTTSSSLSSLELSRATSSGRTVTARPRILLRSVAPTDLKPRWTGSDVSQRNRVIAPTVDHLPSNFARKLFGKPVQAAVPCKMPCASHLSHPTLPKKEPPQEMLRAYPLAASTPIETQQQKRRRVSGLDAPICPEVLDRGTGPMGSPPAAEEVDEATRRVSRSTQTSPLPKKRRSLLRRSSSLKRAVERILSKGAGQTEDTPRESDVKRRPSFLKALLNRLKTSNGHDGTLSPCGSTRILRSRSMKENRAPTPFARPRRAASVRVRFTDAESWN